MRLQSAIFDMDGTLLDSMGMWRDMGERFLRSRGKEPRENLWEDVNPTSVFETAAYYRKAYGFPEPVDELAAAIEAQIADFYAAEVQPKLGVEKFLSLMKMEGVGMYIATATDRLLVEAGLKHAGIAQYFQGIVTCREAGASKSASAAVFERALTRLRSNQENTVVFEDSLPAIRTAKAAGFRVAGVYEALFEKDQREIQAVSDYYVRSFEDFYREGYL